MMSGMPRLPARLAAGRRLDDRLGGPGGSAEGGEEELEELRLSWERNSWSSACKSAICFWAWSKAARSLPHSGQENSGVAGSWLIRLITIPRPERIAWNLAIIRSATA